MELAGLGRRFVARFIDGFLLLTIDALFGVSAVLLDDRSVDPLAGIFGVLFLFSLLFSGPIYETWLIGRSGQTIGKRALGISVVGATSGDKPSYGDALSRAVVIFASGIIPLLLFLVFAWALWDDRKQGLHDKAAGTLVIRRPR
ncbi:MAG: RDD family protein [Actinomycetota bacterium]|nr:RDD family protein [Actinomycetota bacterium]